jgi:cell division septation protein DedD
VIALLLTGTVFALGVMVGKNLAPQVRQSPGTVSLLDRLDAAQSDAGAPDALTFQEELTKRTVPERPLPTAIHAPAIKVERPAPSAINLPTLPEVTPTSAATAIGPTKDGGGAEVVLTTREARPKLPPPPLPKVEPLAPSLFTVQVKATQSQAEADKFAAKLHLQGYHSSVAEADVAGKGRWYRVRVGRFDSRAQAEHYLSDFERETHLQAFVTAVSQ